MASTAAVAQNGLTEIQTDYNMQILAISPNGKYVAGATGDKAFVGDWAENKFSYFDAESVEGTAEARDVDNDGVAVGYNMYAFKMKLDGTHEYLEGSGGIGEGITSDGSVVCGSVDRTIDDPDDSYATWLTHACIWKDGKMQVLPEPTDAWLKFTSNGTSAKAINGDGTVIAGQIVDDMATYPAVVWHQNRDGSYSADPISRNKFEVGDGDNPFWVYQVTGISENGKWLTFLLQENGSYSYTLGRYNLDTDEMEVCKLDGSDPNFPAETSLYSSKVANDGTIVGWAEPALNSRLGIIWKPGEPAAKLLADEYSAAGKFAEYDVSFTHTPTDITPDGKYITGFGMNTEGYIVGYVFNTEEYDPTATAISNVTAQKENNRKDAIYTIGGTQVKDLTNGVNIVRRNGKVSKLLIRK